MNTLDTLNVTINPIDDAALESIDGGLLPLILAFALGFAIGFGGAAAADW